jgi:GT2 family glycosyltransferase
LIPNYHILLYLPQSSRSFSPYLSDLENSKLKIIHKDFDPKTPYAVKINSCIGKASSDYVCIIDENLTGFTPGWLYTLLGQAIQKNIGAVAPKLLYPNDVVFSNGIILLPNGTIYHLSRGEEQFINGYFGWAKICRGYSALSEKCLLFKADDFQRLKGFKENIEDPLFACIDFCLRLREMDLRNILCPGVTLYINNDKRYNSSLEELRIDDVPSFFYKSWEKWFLADPAFNKNLDVVNGRILPRINQIKRKKQFQ